MNAASHTTSQFECERTEGSPECSTNYTARNHQNPVFAAGSGNSRQPEIIIVSYETKRSKTGENNGR